MVLRRKYFCLVTLPPGEYFLMIAMDVIFTLFFYTLFIFFRAIIICVVSREQNCSPHRDFTAMTEQPLITLQLQRRLCRVINQRLAKKLSRGKERLRRQQTEHWSLPFSLASAFLSSAFLSLTPHSNLVTGYRNGNEDAVSCEGKRQGHVTMCVQVKFLMHGVKQYRHTYMVDRPYAAQMLTTNLLSLFVLHG